MALHAAKSLRLTRWKYLVNFNAVDTSWITCVRVYVCMCVYARASTLDYFAQLGNHANTIGLGLNLEAVL